jgi:tetratricopeptide (TPR) repeat protein
MATPCYRPHWTEEAGWGDELESFALHRLTDAPYTYINVFAYYTRASHPEEFMEWAGKVSARHSELRAMLQLALQIEDRLVEPNPSIDCAAILAETDRLICSSAVLSKLERASRACVFERNSTRAIYEAAWEDAYNCASQERAFECLHSVFTLVLEQNCPGPARRLERAYDLTPRRAEPKIVPAGDPDRVRALHKRAFDLQRDKQTDAALAMYKQALALDPNHVPSLYEIGWSYWVLGYWVELVRVWERVLALDPDHELGRYIEEARRNAATMERLRRGPAQR